MSRRRFKKPVEDVVSPENLGYLPLRRLYPIMGLVISLVLGYLYIDYQKIIDDPKKYSQIKTTGKKIKGPAEDPYIWHEDGKYRAIVKRIKHHEKAGRMFSLVQYESEDGLDLWSVLHGLE